MRLLLRCTEPSSTYRTFNSRPSFFTSTGLPLNVNAVLRAITNAPLMRDKSVVRLSVTPSTKYSCSWSPPMFANGSTTMDRRGAEEKGGTVRSVGQYSHSDQLRRCELGGL